MAMKSNIKLIFKEENEMKEFSIFFFKLLLQNKDWFKNCNYHSRKNILYIYTHGYTQINNFITNNSKKYNYQIIKL